MVEFWGSSWVESLAKRVVESQLRERTCERLVSGLRCRVGRPLYLDAIGCPGALIESIPVLSSAASKVEVCIGEQTFAALRRAPVARFGTVPRQGGRTGADPNAGATSGYRLADCGRSRARRVAKKTM